MPKGAEKTIIDYKLTRYACFYQRNLTRKGNYSLNQTAKKAGVNMFKKVYVEITNICNLKCKFCPDTKRKKEYMDSNSFEKIINEISKYTNMVCLHVKGEPLMHPDLEGILTILDKYDLMANITTNGTILKEKIKTLNNHKCVKQINISLHSFVENPINNDSYLNEVFESVQKLNNTINISSRLWNLSSLENNGHNVNIIRKIEKFYEIKNLCEILKENPFFEIKKNIFINQDIEFTWPNINGKAINETGRCMALKDQIAVLVDGTVVPCCLDNDGDIPLGNILNESIENILNKDYAKLILKNFQNGEITCELCKTCGFLRRLENKRK